MPGNGRIRSTEDNDMATATDPALRTALSPWEQELFDHVTAHTEQESELLAEYEALAERSPNAFVRYLATLLLEDEHRHHRLFVQLANTIVDNATLVENPDDVPHLTTPHDAADLRALTAQLLGLEEDDRVQLGRLRKRLRSVRDTTLWDLIVQIAERDTEKHLLILQFIERVARQAAR